MASAPSPPAAQAALHPVHVDAGRDDTVEPAVLGATIGSTAISTWRCDSRAPDRAWTKNWPGRCAAGHHGLSAMLKRRHDAVRRTASRLPSGPKRETLLMATKRPRPCRAPCRTAGRHCAHRGARQAVISMARVVRTTSALPAGGFDGAVGQGGPRRFLAALQLQAAAPDGEQQQRHQRRHEQQQERRVDRDPRRHHLPGVCDAGDAAGSDSARRFARR